MRTRSTRIIFALALSSLFVSMAPTSAEARSGFDPDYHTGWMGFFAGPTFGTDDEPILWRLGLRGGVGARIGGSPLAIDGGLALDGAYSRGTGPFDSTISTRHIEIVPFGRALILLSDSISFYVGFGMGYVHAKTKAEFPIIGTTETNATGLLLRIMGGVEIAISDEVRVFAEPVGLNSYRFDGASTELFSVLLGAGAVF